MKLKELAVDNFKYDKNGGKFLKKGRQHCRKGINCSLQTMNHFPTVFSEDLYYRHVKTRACLGKRQKSASYECMEFVRKTPYMLHHIFSNLKKSEGQTM